MSRILLAEDDSALRGHIARVLEKAGHRVIAVGSGVEALPRLRAEPFDLLVTDVVMPEMDGIELAQHCTVHCPRTRIVFVTGFAAVMLEAEQAAPGARVLSKPFHLRDLVSEVERALALPACAGGW